MSKGRNRRNKGTRPFMPLPGKKNNGQAAMKVVPEAMIEEEEKAPHAGTETVDQAEFDKMRAERDSYLDLARRERADFDNYRKRVEREMGEIKRESLSGFLKEFFGPLDDLNRVIAESEKNHSFEAMATGVKILQDNFWRVLTKAGIQKIEAKDQPFDPVMHEAMAAVPSGDVAPNTVVDVYENGYMFGDRVLRPARVIVSREPDPEP